MDLIYQDLIKYVLDNGKIKENRTGIKTYSVFGHQAKFDLTKGFPLQTTKKIHWKSIVHELLWFISGSTNIKYLTYNGVRIWNEWASSNGELGPVYGKQWRNWQGANGVTDQLQLAIDQIKNNPDSRRIIVNAWNVDDIPQMALAPCHTMFQFYVNDDELSCQLYQRSADLFLGVPFNIASYALLTMMIAKITNKKAKEFIHTFGDLHVYENHLDQCNLVLSRHPTAAPKVTFSERANSDSFKIEDFKYEDIILTDYHPHPAIKGEVAI